MNAVTNGILTAASRQWASRPNDERFCSLPDLHAKVSHVKDTSRASVVSTRAIEVRPAQDDNRRGIEIFDRSEKVDLSTPTHWSFGQIATLAGAPAGYLRKMPAPIVADCLNYGLRFNREAEDVGLLTSTAISSEGMQRFQNGEMRAATGPNYGRIWNKDIVEALMNKFGDGVTGDFKVPGEFGKDVPITKQNTTIYGSDRDMFVFLADEKNRIDISNRRNGETGSLARGFFVWNSEVGAGTFGVAFFMFDYVCMNRIVWGAREYKEMRLRHTSKAPDRWIEEVAPVLVEYSKATALPIEQTIKAAQQAKIDEDLDAFFAKRFTKPEITGIKAAHEREEGRPIETVWDATTGVTAYAKTIQWQDERVAMERKGGALLDLVAA